MKFLCLPLMELSTAYVQAMKRLIDTHKTELSTLGEPPGFPDLSGAQKVAVDPSESRQHSGR